MNQIFLHPVLFLSVVEHNSIKLYLIHFVYWHTVSKNKPLNSAQVLLYYSKTSVMNIL